jgi:acetolactate synthase-1/3 small subunit
MTVHTLSVLVENKPGVLARVAGLFSRRGFNIESLAVGHSEVPGLSRITAVVDVEDLPLEQVTKQLNKLINVIKIVELEPSQSVLHEHVLVKVKVDAGTRPQVLEIVELFRATVVDVTQEALVIELVAGSQRTAGLLKMLEPYGIRELAQSGLLAMGRGPKSITERIPRP